MWHYTHTFNADDERENFELVAIKRICIITSLSTTATNSFQLCCIQNVSHILAQPLLLLMMIFHTKKEPRR
jgi:hypothetical protein